MKRSFYRFQHANALILYYRAGYNTIEQHYKGRFHIGGVRLDGHGAYVRYTILRSLEGGIYHTWWKDQDGIRNNHYRVYYECCISRHKNAICTRKNLSECHTFLIRAFY